jgi:hypothetical protein
MVGKLELEWLTNADRPLGARAPSPAVHSNAQFGGITGRI